MGWVVIRLPEYPEHAYWVCSCGTKFEEYAYPTYHRVDALTEDDQGGPVDRGWRQAIEHHRAHDAANEHHGILGLFGVEGDSIFKGHLRNDAVVAKVIPNSAEANHKNLSQPPGGAPPGFEGNDAAVAAATSGGNRGKRVGESATGSFMFLPSFGIPIVEVVKMWFAWVRSVCPQDYPDDSPETLAEFIGDAVTGFMFQNAETYNLDQMMISHALRTVREQTIREVQDVGFE